MTSLLRAWGAARDKNELEIPKNELGDPLSPLDDGLPDWRWEYSLDKWHSYARNESIEIERYFQYYTRCTGNSEKRPRIARLHLGGQEVILDFRNMTSRVGNGKPRAMLRHHVPSDWLDNAFFWEAFQKVLGNYSKQLRAKPEQLFDMRFNEDLRGAAPSCPPRRPRGTANYSYEPPHGWKRFAANVSGRYDEGDNHWFQERGPGSWAVAYFGLPGEGYRLATLLAGFPGAVAAWNVVDVGMSLTPILEVAASDAQAESINGREVKLVLQLRVRPSAIQRDTQLWHVKSASDVRIYGVLVREAAPACL